MLLMSTENVFENDYLNDILYKKIYINKTRQLCHIKNFKKITVSSVKGLQSYRFINFITRGILLN